MTGGGEHLAFRLCRLLRLLLGHLQFSGTFVHLKFKIRMRPAQTVRKASIARFVAPQALNHFLEGIHHILGLAERAFGFDFVAKVTLFQR